MLLAFTEKIYPVTKKNLRNLQVQLIHEEIEFASSVAIP